MRKALMFVAILLPLSASAQLTSSPSGSVLSAPGGRYVFGQVSEYQRDKFLLDTQTGRLWQMVCAMSDKDAPGKCKLFAMEPVTFTDSSGNISGALPTTK